MSNWLYTIGTWNCNFTDTGRQTNRKKTNRPIGRVWEFIGRKFYFKLGWFRVLGFKFVIQIRFVVRITWLYSTYNCRSKPPFPFLQPAPPPPHNHPFLFSIRPHYSGILKYLSMFLWGRTLQTFRLFYFKFFFVLFLNCLSNLTANKTMSMTIFVY